MRDLIWNPYLPENEFIPDGEPHIFGGRVYIYGSHDSPNGKTFCERDYVCYSADGNDLSHWKYEGVIYKKDQDPLNTASEQHNLYAPDVQRGPDGRYYLYYGLDMTGILSVAVCDTPAGSYEYYGHVQNPDGSVFRKDFPYDPGVLYEDKDHIYLYYGFCFAFPIPGGVPSRSGMMVRLSDDMKTVITEPSCLIPSKNSAAGTGFEGHSFFEASSIRRINGIYYLVYCAENSSELCYAMSRNPDRGFQYGGVLISNADFDFGGNETPVNYYGNNHGGILNVGKESYIFYHRHTCGTQFSRQGCAEKIHIHEDGRIGQAEVTSQGLYGEPLPAGHAYPISIICNLKGPHGAEELPLFDRKLSPDAPILLPDAEGNLILENLQPGAEAAVKYLNFQGPTLKSMTITVKGSSGSIEVYADSLKLAEFRISGSGWHEETVPIVPCDLPSCRLAFRCSGADDTSISIRQFKFVQ